MLSSMKLVFMAFAPSIFFLLCKAFIFPNTGIFPFLSRDSWRLMTFKEQVVKFMKCRRLVPHESVLYRLRLFIFAAPTRFGLRDYNFKTHNSCVMPYTTKIPHY